MVANFGAALNEVPYCFSLSLCPLLFLGCRQKQIRSISVVPPTPHLNSLGFLLSAEVCLPDFQLGPTVVAHTLTRVSTWSVVSNHTCRPGAPVPVCCNPEGLVLQGYTHHEGPSAVLTEDLGLSAT